ncbi:MAG: hypothetical protein WBM52_09215 [Thiogranum sp.]
MNRCDNDCWTENPLAQVRLLYTELAQHPEKDFGWAKGKENARMLGYAEEWLNLLPDNASDHHVIPIGSAAE